MSVVGAGDQNDVEVAPFEQPAVIEKSSTSPPAAFALRLARSRPDRPMRRSGSRESAPGSGRAPAPSCRPRSGHTARHRPSCEPFLPSRIHHDATPGPATQVPSRCRRASPRAACRFGSPGDRSPKPDIRRAGYGVLYLYKTYAIKGLTMGKVAITVTVVSEPPGQKAVFKGGTDGGNRDPARAEDLRPGAGDPRHRPGRPRRRVRRARRSVRMREVDAAADDRRPSNRYPRARS